ncbi:MAG: hypothetical protein N2Z81_07295 [Hydrogenothermaceae bacterium]|nr:hypothetical protein [Hydrogenothermaceae bacterium]
MIKRNFTGIDGDIVISLSKDRKILEGEVGNKIYVIPSDKLIYFREKTELRNPKEILDYYKLKIEEKYKQDVMFDIYLNKDIVEVLVVKEFEKTKRLLCS